MRSPRNTTDRLTDPQPSSSSTMGVPSGAPIIRGGLDAMTPLLYGGWEDVIRLHPGDHIHMRQIPPIMPEHFRGMSHDLVWIDEFDPIARIEPLRSPDHMLNSWSLHGDWIRNLDWTPKPTTQEEPSEMASAEPIPDECASNMDYLQDAQPQAISQRATLLGAMVVEKDEDDMLRFDNHADGFSVEDKKHCTSKRFAARQAGQDLSDHALIIVHPSMRTQPDIQATPYRMRYSKDRHIGWLRNSGNQRDLLRLAALNQNVSITQFVASVYPDLVSYDPADGFWPQDVDPDPLMRRCLELFEVPWREEVIVPCDGAKEFYLS